MVPPADDRELRMLTGVMVPAKQARIPALDDGIFRTGGVEVGTRVDSGAVMFHLDQVGLDEQIVQARRSVSTARRRLARSRELARFADTDASAAERLGTWLPAGDLSRARHGRTLSGIDEEVAAAELEEAQTRLHASIERRDRSAVLAPFDGTITRLEFDDGEWVTRGTTLARVESVGALRIRTAVPVPALECMSIGATVGWRPHTRPTAAGGTATVDFVSPRLDESSGLMLVELEPDQPVDSAVPGEQIALHAPCWQ